MDGAAGFILRTGRTPREKMRAVKRWLWPIETARMQLIPGRREHAEAFADAAVESHAELAQWSRRVAGDRESYLQQALARVEPTVAGQFVRRHGFTRETPGRLVCTLSIQEWRLPAAGGAESPPRLRVDECSDLELGYWCRTSMAGQGYASEAVTAVIEHAFRDLGTEVIWLRIGEANARSRRLAERLCFVEAKRIDFDASPEWGEAATVLFMRRDRH